MRLRKGRKFMIMFRVQPFQFGDVADSIIRNMSVDTAGKHCKHSMEGHGRVTPLVTKKNQLVLVGLV